jgi:1-acyl-sn-glycerol-3-phosphate acyltransferase
MLKKKICYSDELHDEFSGVVRNTVTVDEKYVYRHSGLLWSAGEFLLYRIIMTPVAWLYLTFKFHVKFVNSSVLKKSRGKPVFLFGNHTQIPGDGYIPSVLMFPVKCAVIVNADNVSLPGTRTFMKMVGAVPIPNKLSGMHRYMDYLAYLVQKKRCIMVYPEAHVWPYYTGIRPFPADAFRYPEMFDATSYCFTTTYQQRKHSRHADMTVFVDGPFTVDRLLSRKGRIRVLRDAVYEKMKERSSGSTYKFIEYEKVMKENDSDSVLR